nr:SCO family protein [uncultured Rhodopila sp.]
MMSLRPVRNRPAGAAGFARLLLIFLAVLSLPARADEGASAVAYDERLGNQVPLTVRLRDEHGARVTLGQMLGHRPTILVLGHFHGPNLCGPVREDLINALSRFDRPADYSLVVMSVDPSETPADAQAARQADVDRSGDAKDAANWHYLTGAESAISIVTEAVGFRLHIDDRTKLLVHPAGLVFLTKDGGVSNYLTGLDYTPNDIALGLSQAASDLSARVLPVLLLCFRKDRIGGRFWRLLHWRRTRRLSGQGGGVARPDGLRQQ